MRRAILISAFPVLLPAQPVLEDFRLEVAADAWRPAIRGTLESQGVPIDLRRDLALGPAWTFFGKLTFQPSRRHRLFIEGAPYNVEQSTTLSREITYRGRTYLLNEPISSTASVSYLAGGYQFNLVAGQRGHFGLSLAAARLSAEGRIESLQRGFNATAEEWVVLPLAGGSVRWFATRNFCVEGEARGIAVPDYGHFVQGSGGVCAGAGRFFVTGGYRFVDASVETSSLRLMPAFRGPYVGIRFRL